MPVYNPGVFLVDAIESILNQTYTNFEFIIVDDASTDNSWKIVKSYAKKDKRIKSFRNPINLGVSLTANIAISKTKGKFIARMDSDDVSSSNRLSKQIKFLQNHPKIILIGGQCTIIDNNGQTLGYKTFPQASHQALLDMLFWAVPVQQGSMMINRSLLPKNFVWYKANKTSAEEIDLFFNLSQYGQFANLADNLYFYRQISNSLSHLNPKKTFYLTLQSRINAVNNGFQPSAKAWFLNFAQIIAIAILPASAIYQLWYLLRGVSQLKLKLAFLSPANIKA